MKFFKKFGRFNVVRLKVFQILIVVFGLLILAIEVDARLGGGGGYRSSRSRGSSFGGGGGSGLSFGGGRSLSSRGSWSLIEFFIAIVIFAVIFVISCFTEKYSIPKKITSRRLRKGFSNLENKRIQSVLNAIKFHDENFDLEKFFYQMKLTFIKMQWAMANNKLASCRHFFSDGMFERVQLLKRLNKVCFLHNHIENIVVNNIEVIEARRSDGYERLDLKIDAAARDYYLDSRNDRFVCGDKKQQQFTEVWTLLRCGGVKTNVNNEGLYSKHCPHCGSELKLIDEVVCASCKVRVNTGQYDWVLTEITQFEEWLAQQDVSHQALNDIKRVDPSFNLANVEDKISVIFWRNIAARMLADIRIVSRFADQHFVEKYKDIYKKDVNGKREFYTDVAVGAVELREIVLNCDDGYDRIRAKIKWSCRVVKEKLPKLIKPNFDNAIHVENDMVLKRKVGVKSPAVNTLSSNICLNCGAGEGEKYLPYCEYCHKPLNDGSLDWVLDDLTVFNDYSTSGAMRKKYCKNVDYSRLPKKPQQVKTQDNNVCSIDELATMLWLTPQQVDANVNDVNNALFDKKVSKKGNCGLVNDETNSNIMHHAEKQNSDFEHDIININKQNVIFCAIAVMYADGVIDDKEYETLLAIGKSANFDKKYVDYLIDQVVKGESVIEQPENEHQIDELINAMCVMAMIDGIVTKKERELIYTLGEDLGRSHAEINVTIKRVERELLKEIKKLTK
ncbi:TIM44-like domain-containing protein [Lentisphaerota bacterium WC36G]|nr:TIM44-like domain-containing protein [Lentisphaerae bacterium WC36]